MATLQTSGAISINDIKTLFGGPATPALSNYYRGGTYIPATKVVSTLVYDPTSGEYYSGASPYWMWYVTVGDQTRIYWNSASETFAGISTTATTYTSGSYTYYRGTLRQTIPAGKIPQTDWYGVYRSSGSSSTVNINTNIPTSGAVSLSQFYGAEKP